MRLATACLIIGVALSSALALHRWHPTKTISVAIPDATRVPYTGFNSASQAFGVQPTHLELHTVGAYWWWKDPAAVLVVFVGLGAATGLVARQRQTYQL